jgi:hypothetical protein
MRLNIVGTHHLVSKSSPESVKWVEGDGALRVARVAENNVAYSVVGI